MTEAEIVAIIPSIKSLVDEHAKSNLVRNQCFKTSHRLGTAVRNVLIGAHPHYTSEPIWVEIGNLSIKDQPLLDVAICRHFSENLPPRNLGEKTGIPEEYYAWLRFAGTVVDLTFRYTMAGMEHSKDLKPHPYYVSAGGARLPEEYPFSYDPYRRWSIADIRARGHN